MRFEKGRFRSWAGKEILGWCSRNHNLLPREIPGAGTGGEWSPQRPHPPLPENASARYDQSTTEMICSYCDASMPDISGFCPACGRSTRSRPPGAIDLEE